MKYIKFLSIVALAGLVAWGCKSPLANENFDELNLPTGGYMRIVTPFPVGNGTFNVSIANMGGTRLQLVHEAVTPNKGANFAQYDLVIRYVGANAVADRPLRSIPASAFAPDPQTGYPRHTTIITGQEALTATGLRLDQIAAGGRFEVRGTMRLTDGSSFTAANTGVNITGGAFYSSPFFYRINVVN